MKSINLLLFLMSVLLSLAVFEVVLRIDDWSSSEEKLHSVELNGRIYEFVEDRRKFRAYKNSVIVIGDSFVVGRKCGTAKNITGHLSSILAASSAGHEVINLGRSGTSVFSYYQTLHDVMIEFGTPGAVVVVMYSNDINFEPMMCASLYEIVNDSRFTDEDLTLIADYCDAYFDTTDPDGDYVDRVFNLRRPQIGGSLNWLLYSHVYVYRLLREIAAQALDRFILTDDIGRAAHPSQWSDSEGIHFRALQFGLEKIDKAANSIGAPIIYVTYPNVEDLSLESRMSMAYKKAIPVLEETLGDKIFSGYEAFDSNPNFERNMVWSLTDPHPNCTAHEIMADWIAKLDVKIRSD